MKIGVPKETQPGETRAPLIPASVQRLAKLGAQIEIEAGTGLGSGHPDAEFIAAGAAISSDRKTLLATSDVVLRVRKPPVEETELLKPGCLHISFLDPFNAVELIRKLADRGVSAISLEMIPRITRAQKMDAVTSQSSLAGYVAVILAAHHLGKIFPMMMTAAGTIAPARVFVIGAGVAGLQAIATAKRLGAQVEAFDTRPAVAEEVRSLGARFIQINLGATGQTTDGYAQALTREQLTQQREMMKRHCLEADVVITTAQVFGRKAPVIVTADVLAAMKPGSVVVDLAIENGGNVEGAVLDQILDRAGVKLIAPAHLAARVPVHASQVYSANLAHLIEALWDNATNRVVVNTDDEIIKASLVTHAGKICHEKLAQLMSI